MNIKQKYCGWITIIGKSNVGKSTLLNKIIGKKISIVSRKKNTTQTHITGINTKKYYQCIYTDTPGFIFNKKNDKIEYKKNIFFNIVKNSTLIMFVIDQVSWTEKDNIIFNKIKKNGIPVIIIINKIDKISNKNILLPFIDFIKKKTQAIEIIPISAKKTKNMMLLYNIVKNYLPKNPHVYPENHITTNSQFFTISEIIREQLILFLGDELPSIVKVEIEYLKEIENNQLHIRALILVIHSRQKKIIIGHNGEKIKKISIISRYKIEKELHKKIHLLLWVKKDTSK
ncbi:GTPase Era [Buchnera aphidicola (Brachycaudus cardui)]|uniref:GTPase Era n=1 Tax=Buchnera aphidicola (Brachycaudus cardui) TaxID=557993 RepID=A0A4D6Y1D9_9GAMM|nr:GTPase Era [Buchnera aphidicola]QCI20398.1 GTPase Era [Buchnera aphidicola (Brachycaudus cardui)]